DQIDLAYLDQPAALLFPEAMAAPARQETHAVGTKLADQEIRSHHAAARAGRGENLYVADHPNRSRFRRLRPGITGAQPKDAILHAAAVVEGNRNFTPGIAAAGSTGHPIDAFQRIHREPFVELELVEEASLALEKRTKPVPLDGVEYDIFRA